MEIIIRQIKIAISLTFLFLPPLSSQGGDLELWSKVVFD